MKTENLTKALHSVELLTSGLRAAHSDAVQAENQFAEIVLLGLLADAAALQDRVKQAQFAVMG